MPEFFDAPTIVEPFTMWILGTPVPQGSKTGFVVGKRAVIVDANKDVLKPWRAKVTAHAISVFEGRETFTGAMFAELDFYMPRPPSVKRERPSVKPDVDKLQRAIFDALTDAGVWKDDSQVVSVHADEWYADHTTPPGVRIRVGKVA